MKGLTISKAVWLAFLAIFFLGNAFAQIDQKRMDRDIEVAEDILMSLMKQDKDVKYHLNGGPRGMYVDGYGVIFNISGTTGPMVMFSGDNHWEFNHDVHVDPDFDFKFDFNDSFMINTNEIAKQAQEIARQALEMAGLNENLTDEEREDLKQALEDVNEAIEEAEREANEASREADRSAREAERAAREEERERREEVRVMVGKPARPPKPKMGHSGSLNQNDFEGLMQNFLADYASLIGQLKPTDKVMISTGANNRRKYGPAEYDGKMSAEVSKKDIDDYKKGKLTREQFNEKIVITKSNDDEPPHKDLELFSTIMERVYERDLAETYYVASGLTYERLANFGVIYGMKVYSSNENRGKYSLPTQNLYDLTFEERNKKVEEMYPKFELELKENILNYGKTIKSLAPDETLLFQVKLTECKDCNMPQSIDVSVKQSVLKEYDNGKLSKAAAMAKISVKKDKK